MGRYLLWVRGEAWEPVCSRQGRRGAPVMSAAACHPSLPGRHGRFTEADHSGRRLCSPPLSCRGTLPAPLSTVTPPALLRSLRNSLKAESVTEASGHTNGSLGLQSGNPSAFTHTGAFQESSHGTIRACSRVHSGTTPKVVSRLQGMAH